MPSSASPQPSLTLSSDETDPGFARINDLSAIQASLIEPTSAAAEFPHSLSTPSFFRAAKEVVRSRTEVLQQWRGYVLEKGKDSFIAVLENTSNPARPDEQVEIAMEQLSESDIPLVEEGALFELVILARLAGAERQRLSFIRFRRLPRWTASELRRVDEKAEALGRRLEIPDEETNTAGS